MTEASGQTSRIWSRLRIRSLVVTAALSAVSILAIPSSAWAEPIGCSHSTDFWTSANGGSGYLLIGHGEGDCNQRGTRTLRVQVKVNLWPSDVVLGQGDDNWTGTIYELTISSCDNGLTKEYYARSYFTQSPTWVDAGYVTVHACR
jgi:hypothetical protein